MAAYMSASKYLHNHSSRSHKNSLGASDVM